MRHSRLLAFLLFGFFYALGNIGGNWAGWEVILAWFESANGAKTIHPMLTHPLVLLCLAILPSVGQWFWEWVGVESKWKWAVLAVMACDWAINTVGFYYLAMGEFSLPPVMSVLIFLAVLALIPNILCQSLATLNLKKLLDGSESRQNRKGGKPAPPPENIRSAMMRGKQEQPAQTARRTNGSIPLDIEEVWR